MLRIDQYDIAIRDLLRNKQAAKSDELATAWDTAWSAMTTSRNHATLVARFDEESAGMRNLAAVLSSTPGGQREAEAIRVRASQLHETAERHRKAAEEYREHSEIQMVDCVAMAKQESQNENGNGEEQKSVPKERRKSDRRQVTEAPQTQQEQQADEQHQRQE